MQTTHLPDTQSEWTTCVPWNDESFQGVLEMLRSRYKGTFELIEDPNSPGKYYDWPY